jgi:hypothetical protein
LQDKRDIKAFEEILGVTIYGEIAKDVGQLTKLIIG